jgi:hypothetical protein
MRWLAAGVLSVLSVAAGAPSAQTAQTGAQATGQASTQASPVTAAMVSPGTTAQSSPPSVEPILVELFTSEGCSSCPPADDLLGKISGKTLPSGRTILTISEHVTYWNHDGWEDPFSSDDATDRQKSYVDRLKVDKGAFTPQMVVDGSAQVVGSDGAALIAALKQADAKTSGVTLTIRDVSQDKGTADVQFVLAGETGKPRKLEVVAFVTDDADQVQVRTGENAHRTLSHVTVARSYQHVDLAKGATTGEVRVKLPSKPPIGAESGRHLIVVAQEEGEGPVLAAAARTL